MTNILEFKPKDTRTIDKLLMLIEYEHLEDGSLWFRHRLEYEEEWSEWEKHE